MKPLDLNLFLQAGLDLEGAQYRVLGKLKHTRDAFSQNVIYPHLGHLIRLQEQLSTIVSEMEDARENHPDGEIQGVDLVTATILRKQPDMGDGQLEALEELIRWALPVIQGTIEEGKAIFEFVDENSHLEEIGIIPSYVNEGYLLIPDRQTEQLHILQYTLSIYTTADERYRSLKTTHLKSLPEREVLLSRRTIKLDLMNENRELPNPATYACETGLDFPFQETMLPVAKRKLMRYLYEHGEGFA